MRRNKALTKKPSFKTEWAAFEDDLLGQALAIDVLRKNPVNEQEIKKSYDEFAKFYQGSQEVRLGEIVTRTKADGQKAAADLKAKKAFTAVLKQYSIDEEAKKSRRHSSSLCSAERLARSRTASVRSSQRPEKR